MSSCYGDSMMSPPCLLARHNAPRLDFCLSTNSDFEFLFCTAVFSDCPFFIIYVLLCRFEIDVGVVNPLPEALKKSCLFPVTLP